MRRLRIGRKMANIITTAELESIIALAKHDQKEIARLRCGEWGKANLKNAPAENGVF